MVGIGSCTCPPQTYPVLSSDGLSVQRCTQCPSSCAGAPVTSSFFWACPACAATSTPPFAVATPVSPFYTCPSSFSPAPVSATPIALAPEATVGSSLFVSSAAAWSRVVAPLPFATCNPLQAEPAQVSNSFPKSYITRHALAPFLPV